MGIEISVIIPVYNSSSYILETLNSVKKQTFTNYEIIIVDDKSTDNSLEIVKSFKKLNPQINIKIIVNLKNLGPAKTRTIGINSSRGKYILPLDSDDLISEQYMEKMISFAKNNPLYAYWYCDTVYFNEKNENQRFYQPEFNFIRLIEGNFISYCSLISKNVFMSCGGYEEDNYGYCEDYFLYLKMAMKGFIGKHLSEPLFFYRVRQNSLSHDQEGSKKMQAAKMYFIKKYKEYFPEKWLEIANEELRHWDEDFLSRKNSIRKD